MCRVTLFSLVFLCACGQSHFDACGSQKGRTLADYGQPSRSIAFSPKGEWVGGSVYYYPDNGFIKAFDSQLPDDDNDMGKCSERYIITDAEKFVKTCKRFDCAGAVFYPAEVNK
jgi:hypothetical protein